MDDSDLEAATFEAIVKFSDELDHRRHISIDDFLLQYPEASQQVRPYLETVLNVRNNLAHIRLSQAESITLFSNICKRLSNTNSSCTGLDRRPDVMILLLHFMRDLLQLDVWGDTKLVKLLFLLGKEAGCDQLVPDFYGHYAYSFGAFDDAVPKDAEMLAQKKIITMGRPEQHLTFGSEELGIPNERLVNNIYRLTERGEKFAQLLLKDAISKNPEVVESFKRVILAHGKKSTDELLRYTYTKYPETAKNSKVRDRYLNPDSNSSDDLKEE